MDEPKPDTLNMPMAVVGAALGAALGGLLWFAVEYFLRYQVGFIALLCGPAAGFGAVTLGKGHAFRVGVVAAAFGLLGLVGGSYGSYVARKAADVDRIEKEMAGMPDAERAVLRAQVDRAIAEYTYVEHVKQDKKGAVWMALFGVIGLAYGFMLGSRGLGRGDDDDDDEPDFDDDE